MFDLYPGDDKRIKMVKGKHNDPRPTDCIKEVIKFLIANLGKIREKE